MADLLEMESSDGGKEESAFTPEEKAFLDDCFLYHAPDSDKKDRLFEVNAAAKEFAETILIYAPQSADRSAALRAVREAKMWANSAIVLEGRR